MSAWKKTALACVVMGLACATANAKPLRIGAAVYGLKGEFMQMWTNALKAHPAVKDGSVQITVFDGNYDALTQSNQFDTMITQKYDAIIFVPIDKAAGAAAVAKAAAAHIPVVGSNTRVSGDKLTSYVGNDDVVAGRMEAEAIVTAIGGKGNVVIIEGPIGQSAQIDRSQGIQEVLAKHPGVKVLEHKTANWSRAESLGLVENWLTAHPGQINGIIAENDDEALGAIQALKSKGIDPKKLPVAGIDGITDGVAAVKRGEMTTFFQDSRAQAQGALDVALRAVQGASYKPRSEIWADYGAKMPWGDGTAKSYTVPWTQVTPGNADEYLKKIPKRN
ncbi:TPA: substrate-binding domain-containing protein [Burkholderia aenigmatica]|nr:substrate-binding domain-containing protein [Burkholderia aenigmatica]HDR9520071.1 substrate-binding domain-containing protein [Burkholderia aenigmatica]HDR9597177.1 substrate-binding domain-containing protein [Burkholderia aenigmatica]HDR9605070.1 substrate-binding domain-containing protein [Burkholderia aenigmatica]HDR9612890.1 substrate-binding domain-containing protein [Burkholderia aenigmatica]